MASAFAQIVGAVVLAVVLVVLCCVYQILGSIRRIATGLAGARPASICEGWHAYRRRNRGREFVSASE